MLNIDSEKDLVKNGIEFDHEIKSVLLLPEASVQNLAELIFNTLDHRSENGEVILGHHDKQFIRISLHRFRYIHYRLYKEFEDKGIRQGDTVLLASVNGNNEMFQAILFSALSSYGVRVLMPMFMETNELETWIDLSDCAGAFIPISEIQSLDHHEKAKEIVKEIVRISDRRGLQVWDTFNSFEIMDWLSCKVPPLEFRSDPIVTNVIHKTNLENEALLITTSGSTGLSKLVVYNQGAFVRSCISWQIAGMLHKNVLGGRGFTPLFTHTMGIRTFFNGLWTGNPVCLINTDWFDEYPEIVRYFLLKMKPEHITGGPAAYELLLEMTRNFPELIPVFRENFKTLVSSGASFDSKLAHVLESIFELPIQNALGTTETQQVTNTLLDEYSIDSESSQIGTPLPGVKLGLKRDDKGHTYRLYIYSPFGCKGILSKQKIIPADEYFFSGDIVEFKNGKILYSGRDGKDFFKDGFGVKIPIQSVRKYYQELAETVSYIDFFILQGEPGLAILIFINNPFLSGGIITDKQIISSIRNRIEVINDQLFRDLNPFEFRHRTVRRFTVVNTEPPKTIKGNISQHLIEKRYASIIQALRKYFASEDWIHTVKSRQIKFDAFTEHANSYVGRYLRDIKMDFVYHKADKDTLFTTKGGSEIGILDLVGGFGGNLLGHNNPSLKHVVNEFLDHNAVSISNQGSILSEVGQLAEYLNDIMRLETGRNFRVCLGSTGSEAVEMALHHACLEWINKIDKMEQQQLQNFGSDTKGMAREIWAQNKQKLDLLRLKVITLKSAFHGHSSGARSLIGSPKQRNNFTNILGIESCPIDNSRKDWQSQILQCVEDSNVELIVLEKNNGSIQTRIVKVSTIIAAIAEPITGEGGVQEVEKELLDYLSEFEFPLILDEIQSGLGRSGNFLASKGVPGDYYLFAKSLGGGLEKISALLVDKCRYKEEFGKYYTTTFGNGERAARVALETLKLIKRSELPARAQKLGAQIKNRLLEVNRKYPDVFEKISGRGLMIGIWFRDFSKLDNIILRMLYRHEFLGYVSSSYMLNEHNIRVLPTLSAPNVLRVEPSAFITDEEINKMVSAFENLALLIRNRSLYKLFRHFMEDDPFDDDKGHEPPGGLIYPGLDPPANGAKQITFLAHFTSPTEELRILEPSFAAASSTGLRLLFNHLQVLMEMKPVTLFSKNLFDNRINFQMKVIPLGSAELEQMHRTGKKRKIIEKIQQAVNEAAQEGSEIVALGGYNSIFTHNGMALVLPKNTKVITGNTLTAASGIARLLHELQTRSHLYKQCTLGIVGAAGNIGHAITAYMLKQDSFFNQINLIVHNRKQELWLKRQLHKRIEDLPPIKVTYSTDMKSLRECDVAIITTNCSKPIVFPQHIKEDSEVLISDNSVPSAIAEEVSKLKNVTVVPFSSYLKLPMDPDFIISSHTPRGTAFCCAVEAMLCALEDVNVLLRGNLEESSIQLMMQLAKKWGLFGEFGVVKSFKSNVYS